MGNDYGQLGDGTIQSTNSTPVADSPTRRGHWNHGNATAISVGVNDSCAILSTGAVDCWGSNDAGQLGDRTTTDSSTPSPLPESLTPQPSPPATAVLCALLSTGAVTAGATTNSGNWVTGRHRPESCQGAACSPIPVVVTGITSATAISAGAVRPARAIPEWRRRLPGPKRLRAARRWDYHARSTPVAVTGIADATAIAAGLDHTCALLVGGGVDGWGDTTGSSTPVAVIGLGVEGAIRATIPPSSWGSWPRRGPQRKSRSSRLPGPVTRTCSFDCSVRPPGERDDVVNPWWTTARPRQIRGSRER